jgi:hypothetical protein
LAVHAAVLLSAQLAFVGALTKLKLRLYQQLLVFARHSKQEQVAPQLTPVIALQACVQQRVESALGFQPESVA